MKCGHCGESIFVAFEYWFYTPGGVPIHEFTTIDGRLECDPYEHAEEIELAEVIEFPNQGKKSVAS